MSALILVEGPLPSSRLDGLADHAVAYAEIRPQSPAAARGSRFSLRALRGLPESSAFLVIAGAMLLAVATGVLVGTGRYGFAIALPAALGMFALGLTNWRLSLIALLAYLPVSGILSIVTYPNTEIGVLAKDIFFIVPAYAGFLVVAMTRSTRLSVPGAPVALFCLLAALALVHAFNPGVPNLTVAGIGLKVWVFYVPLLVLGYHLIRTMEELERVLRIMALTALVPATVGIVEALLIYGGNADLVYAVYGDAASAVTMEFGAVALGDSGVGLRRINSTFSFVSQYYGYLVAMIAVAFAWWRGFLVPRGQSGRGLVLLCVLLTAALLSGQRSAFVFLPFLVVVMVLLESGATTRATSSLVAMTAATFVTVTVLGVSARDLVTTAYEVGIEEFQFLVIDALPRVFSETLVGLGTGTDTQAAFRYGSVGHGQEIGVGGHWFESYWAKAALEFGIVGLVIVAGLLGTLLVRMFRLHRTYPLGSQTRAVSAAIVGFWVFIFVTLFKGPSFDIDPNNVYVWLFAGFLFKLPLLAAAQPGGSARRSPRASEVAEAGAPSSPG